MAALFGPYLTPFPLLAAFGQFIMNALLEPFLTPPPSPLRSYLKYVPETKIVLNLKDWSEFNILMGLFYIDKTNRSEEKDWAIVWQKMMVPHSLPLPTDKKRTFECSDQGLSWDNWRCEDKLPSLETAGKKGTYILWYFLRSIGLIEGLVSLSAESRLSIQILRPLEVSLLTPWIPMFMADLSVWCWSLCLVFSQVPLVLSYVYVQPDPDSTALIIKPESYKLTWQLNCGTMLSML